MSVYFHKPTTQCRYLNTVFKSATTIKLTSISYIILILKLHPFRLKVVFLFNRIYTAKYLFSSVVLFNTVCIFSVGAFVFDYLLAKYEPLNNKLLLLLCFWSQSNIKCSYLTTEMVITPPFNYR